MRTCRSRPSCRARLDRRTHRAVADQQGARRDAGRAKPRQRLEQLAMVLFPAQHRRHAEHQLARREAELRAQRAGRLRRARPPVLEVDAVVDHALAPCRQAAPAPVAALVLAHIGEPVGAPEEGPVIQHLQPFLAARRLRGVPDHGKRRSRARPAPRERGIEQRVGIRRHEVRRLELAEQARQPGERGRVEVTPRLQAAHARRAAQPLELARIVLHIGEVAVVAAFGKPVGKRDRMAFGAAVHQRSGDEQQLHRSAGAI
jgi:hypothetical protein